MKKCTLHCKNCEMSTDGGTDGHAHSNTPSAFLPRCKNSENLSEIQHKEKLINVGTLNCQSLRNKVCKVAEHLINNNIDMCFLQETFMKQHDTAIISELEENSFKMFSFPRNDGREHGGLGVISKFQIKLKCNKSSTSNTYKTFEHFEATMKTNQGLIRFCNIYRPPYSEKHRFTISQFLVEFEEYLKTLVLKPGYSILVGDLNIHMEKVNDHNTHAFTDILNSYGFVQTVSQGVKTQVSGGILDLIIVSDDLPHDVKYVNTLPHGTPSDHFLVYCEINCALNLVDHYSIQMFR